MKRLLLYLVYLGLINISYTAGFTQTNINYETWMGASGCNLFATSTNVPATISGNNTTIPHLTAVGQPLYDNVNKTVNLESRINGSQNEGTEYRINSIFKQGYSYIITITAARIMSVQTGPNVSLRLDINNGGSGNNTACSGTGIIDASGSGNLKQSQQIGGSSFSDYVFNYNAFSAQQAYLMVAAIPPSGSVFQTILIRKIKIEELPPAASFSISPSSTSITCGATTPISFTINNINSTPGITGYSWNLGATPNGWLYNGNPAPSIIPMPSSNLSPLLLTPDCGKKLSNVSATITANGNTYNTTNSASISISQPTYNITGTFSLCSGSTNYTLNGAVCNSTVLWTAPPSNLGTLSSLNTSQTTLTYGGTSGSFNLTANVNSCGVSASVTLPVHVGPYNASDYTLTGGGSATQPLYWCPNQTYAFAVNGQGSNYNWVIPSGWTINYQSNYLNVIKSPSSTYPPTGSVSVSFNEPCGGIIEKSFFTAYSSSACIGTDQRFAFSPNPAPYYINAVVASGYIGSVSIKRIQIINSTTGLTYFDQSYGSGVNTAYITTSSFPTGSYSLKIFDGSTWASYLFIK